MSANAPFLSAGLALTTVAVGSAILWTSRLEVRVKAAEAEGKLLADIDKREEKLEKNLKELQKQSKQLQSKEDDLQRREDKLLSDRASLEEMRNNLDGLKAALESKEKETKTREEKLVKDLASLDEQREDLHRLKTALESKENDLTIQSEKLRQESSTVDDRRKDLDVLKAQLDSQETHLKKREDDLRQKEAELARREPDLQNGSAETVQRPDLDGEDKSSAAVAAAIDEKADRAETTDATEDAETTNEKGGSDKLSEKEMRIKMIEDELQRYVKDAEENELEEPFDEDSLKALKIAAMKICYLKKYYDCMADKIIYFPSVQSSIVNYTLLEEAEKHYFDEDDEYPMDLSVALRSVATAAMAESDDGGDDVDEEYMASLAQDVEI